MKILHTADTHIGTFPGPVQNGKNLRMRDTTNCMVSLANSAIAESPDVILISGDLFHRSRLWADEMLTEIQIAADWLTDLAKVAPVCLLYGTPNHDNLEAFNNLARVVPENVHILTRPERRVVATKAGNIQICALPGFDRGYFRAQNPGVSREDENAVFSSALSQIAIGLRSQCTSDMPAVLMAHYTVPGADLESGQVQIFSQSEPMLTVDTLATAAFDLVALGHIHKPQLVNGFDNVYYAGAINRFNFNDEGQHRGFWYHELSTDNLVSHFVNTPARDFATLQLSDQDIDTFNTIGFLPVLPGIKGCIVRALYSCTDEHEKALNKSALEKYLYDNGAFWIQEISPAEIIVTLDRKAMDEATTPEDNLVAYLAEHGATEARIQAAVELARPIIADAVANARAKRSTGILRPISIEVNNYRNYREASFDFTDVSMCTINGVNGAGKSSLFMDAIVDCLYEEPREAELTGWIRADEDARSGAITFTFAIGDQQYRVSRTRVRSGKATLNLSEMVDGEWRNRSSERLRDTQDEITALLGMDIGTFKSCALIMQDQYGIFLEAGKEQRMETLTAMLGLGIYEAMEDTAKVKAADAARDIRAAKDREERYGADLDRERPATVVRDHALHEISILTQGIDESRQEENEVRGKIVQGVETQNRINSMLDELHRRKVEFSQTEHDHDTVQETIKQLKAILEGESILLEKSTLYDTALASIDAMNEKHLAAQRAYDAAVNEAAGIDRMKSDLKALDTRIQNLTHARGMAEKSAIALMPFKGSAAKRDTAAAEIQRLEGQDAERAKALDALRAVETKRQACAAEWDRTLSAKKAEIETCHERAGLLTDSKCVDPANAKCVFLEDAIRSRDKLPTLSAELNDLQKQADSQITALRTDEADAQMRLAKYQSSADQLVQLRSEHAKHIQDATQYEQHTYFLDRITVIDKELGSLAEEHKALSARIDAASETGNRCEELLSCLQEAERQKQGVYTYINTLRPYADQARQLPDIKARHAAAVEQETRLGKKMLECAQACTQSQKEIDELNATVANLPQLQADLKTVSERITALDTQRGAANARLGAAEKELEIVAAAKDAVATLRTEINALSETASLYGELKQAFSRDGIPHNIIRSIIPTLEATANNILSQMTGGKMSLEFITERTLKSNAKKEVTTLDIFIQESGRSRLPYLSKSGGEKVKVSLSVVLALAEIMSRRAGIQLGMLFIDEPPFLDDMGTQAYCDALEAIRARYPGHTIMAITHDPTMKARFPQSIDIERTEEGSKVIYN